MSPQDSLSKSTTRNGVGSSGDKEKSDQTKSAVNKQPAPTIHTPVEDNQQKQNFRSMSTILIYSYTLYLVVSWSLFARASVVTKQYPRIKFSTLNNCVIQECIEKEITQYYSGDEWIKRVCVGMSVLGIITGIMRFEYCVWWPIVNRKRNTVYDWKHVGNEFMKGEYVYGLRENCMVGNRSDSEEVRRTLLPLRYRIIKSTGISSWSSLGLYAVLLFGVKILVTSFHMIPRPSSFYLIHEALTYWTKKSTNWQIIFGLGLLSPKMSV